MPSPWAQALVRDNPPVVEEVEEDLPTCDQCGSTETVELFYGEEGREDSIFVCAECGAE